MWFLDNFGLKLDSLVVSDTNGLATRKRLKISSNIFNDLHQLHGPEFFSRSDRTNHIKNSLYRYIKASGDYKKVVKTVIGDAVCFHGDYKKVVKKVIGDAVCFHGNYKKVVKTVIGDANRQTYSMISTSFTGRSSSVEAIGRTTSRTHCIAT